MRNCRVRRMHRRSEFIVPGIWKLAKSKRAPSLGGWKNFKEPPGSRQFEVDIWFFFKTRLRTTEISTLIPTVTDRLTAHRQTDQRALVEIIQRPSVRAGSPIQNLSVRPSVRPGRFRRRIKTQNCRVTHRQTDALSEFIYMMWINWKEDLLHLELWTW
jgi:hypothetical protein